MLTQSPGCEIEMVKGDREAVFYFFLGSIQ